MAEDDLIYDDVSDEPRILAAPTLVTHIEGKTGLTAVGGRHSISVMKKGHVYAWGANGELPTLIQGEVKGKKVVSAAAGGNFGVLLVEEG